MEKHMFTYNYYRYRKLDKGSKISEYLFETIVVLSIIFIICVFIF